MPDFSRRTERELHRAIARYGKEAVKKWIDEAPPVEAKTGGAPLQLQLRQKLLIALYRSRTWQSTSRRKFATEIAKTFRIGETRRTKTQLTKRANKELSSRAIETDLRRALVRLKTDPVFKAETDVLADSMVSFLSRNPGDSFAVGSTLTSKVDAAERGTTITFCVRDRRRLALWLKHSRQGTRGPVRT